MTGYFRTDDRVTMDVCRGYRSVGHSIVDGGEYITKHGVVEDADDDYIFVKFDDGDFQRAANVRGKQAGFPGRNVQPDGRQ